MIAIASLSESDKGRSVVYTPRVGPREDGVITSWNDRFVFVHYRSGDTAKATDPRDLDFLLEPR